MAGRDEKYANGGRRPAAILTAALLLAMPAVGCDGNGSVEPESPAVPPIQTDSGVYTFEVFEGGRRDLDISWRYINALNQEVAFVTCGGIPGQILEKRVDGEWREVADNSPLAACLSSPIVLGPGDFHSTFFSRVFGLPDDTVYRPFNFEEFGGPEGTYRLVFIGDPLTAGWEDYKTSIDDENDVVAPKEFRVSNTFIVRDPRP